MFYRILQPIVENAVKHAVAPNTSLTRIEVRVRQEAKSLHIEIVDNGQGINAQTIQEGNGIRIVRDTLALHYPNRHSLWYENTDAGWTFRLSLPAESEDRGR